MLHGIAAFAGVVSGLIGASLRMTVRGSRVIDVHIPMTTLLELDNRTGWVEGLGPVPALLTRLLPVAGLPRLRRPEPRCAPRS